MDTIEELVQEVRELMDEENTDTISDSAVINSLNRAQQHVVSIYSKHYAEPFISYIDYDLKSTVDRYPIPKDAWSDKIIGVAATDSKDGADWFPIRYVRNKQAIKQRYRFNNALPEYYTVQGRQIEFIPAPTGQYTLRAYYIKKPEKFVTSQGRITLVDGTNNRLKVNSLGSDLSTNNDNLQNFINVIDSATGEVKATFEIDTIDTTTNSVTIKTTPTRTTISNKTIGTSISGVVDEYGNAAIELDDHICLYSGTCIPYFDEPSRNFLIQYTVAELQRSLGNPGAGEEQAKNDLEREVKAAWAGRETGLRIDLSSRQWRRNRFRYITNR